MLNSGKIIQNGTNYSSVTTSGCHTWIKDYINISRADITIEEMNSILLLRTKGGIMFISILSAIGLVGNLHVIYFFGWKFKSSIYRIFVLWLSLTDLLNNVLCAPLLVYYLSRPLMYFSQPLCKAFRFILYTLAISSVSTLVVIAAERCHRVTRPTRRPMTINMAKSLCVFWIFVSILLSWPASIIFDITEVPSGIQGLSGRRCLISEEDLDYFAIFSSTHIVIFVFVSAILVAMYSLIGWKIWHQQRIFEKQRSSKNKIMTVFTISKNKDEPGRHSVNDGSHSDSHSHLARTTGTLFLVTLVYILSAIPHHILSALFFVYPNYDCTLSLIGSKFYYTFVWSYMLNSAINPFIYGFRDSRFREKIRKVYAKLFCQIRFRGNKT